MIFFCTHLCKLVDINIIYYRNIFCLFMLHTVLCWHHILVDWSFKVRFIPFAFLPPVCPLPAVDFMFRESDSQCQKSKIKLQYKITNNQKWMYYFSIIIAGHLKAMIQDNQNQWLFCHWLSWNSPAVSSHCRFSF